MAMLRKVNGVMQRRGDDGVWRDIGPDEQARVEALAQSTPEVGATLVEELAELTSAPSAGGNAEAVAPAESGRATKSKSRRGTVVDPSRSTPVKIAGETDVQADSNGALDIGDVPGLLSDESSRSTSGQARLSKLRERARSKSTGSRITARPHKGREVVVPATVAEVSGPDAGGSRLAGGTQRRSVPAKEVPTLLEGRPQWVKDLFEAHFRSDLAYQLRRLPSGSSGKNRMKLSRQDYAIGWLVMFDKAREDPGVLRVRQNGKSG